MVVTICHNKSSCRVTKKINQVFFFLLLGCKNKTHGALLKELMQTNNFRVTVVEEYDVVEICGALKVSFNTTACMKSGILACSVLHLNFYSSTLTLLLSNMENS